MESPTGQVAVVAFQFAQYFLRVKQGGSSKYAVVVLKVLCTPTESTPNVISSFAAKTFGPRISLALLRVS